MLARLRELARQRSSFAFETTLASRSFAPWLKDLLATRYQFHLVFLWLPSPDLAVARVAARVREGGHDVPEETIRRRYEAGLRNFFSLYQPMATTWEFWDNSLEFGLTFVASGSGSATLNANDRATWERIKAGYDR
jgi:predicted ABC-type ATPase